MGPKREMNEYRIEKEKKRRVGKEKRKGFRTEKMREREKKVCARNTKRPHFKDAPGLHSQAQNANLVCVCPVPEISA